LELDLDLKLDLDLELLWSMSAIWILPLPRVARTLVLELRLLLVKSSTKLLNRDIKDTEVNIYNIASHKGLKGEIDTRLLTKNGRIQIGSTVFNKTPSIHCIDASPIFHQ
jgi:hypothetical protein